VREDLPDIDPRGAQPESGFYDEDGTGERAQKSEFVENTAQVRASEKMQLPKSLASG
jgi:hypothetical protein